MSTKVSSVPRWSGSVDLPGYMSFSQLSVWEKALATARKNADDQNTAEFYMSLLPAVLEIVTDWRIDGLENPPALDTFPASPKLVSFLIEAVTELYTNTNEVAETNSK